MQDMIDNFINTKLYYIWNVFLFKFCNRLADKERLCFTSETEGSVRL